MVLPKWRLNSEDAETIFEELGEQSPPQRFHRYMAKGSRRYELLVFAVEACYLVIYTAYFLIHLQSQAADSGDENFGEQVKSATYDFYTSCIDERLPKNRAEMPRVVNDTVHGVAESRMSPASAKHDVSESSLESSRILRNYVFQVVMFTDQCKSEVLGENAIGVFISAIQINHFIPVLIVILRAYRLFGCGVQLRVCCRVKSAWLRWVLDTLFHTLVLSWYGTMAGLFSVMHLTGGGQAQKFLDSLYNGPVLYIFLLTVTCLMLLDVRQTVIASSISYSCFAIPSLTGLLKLMVKAEVGGQKLMAMDQLMLFVSIIAVCCARYSSWRDRAGDFKRTDELMVGIINEKVKRCAAEFTAEQVQASWQKETRDVQSDFDSDYLDISSVLQVDPSVASPAAIWPTPPSCLSAPADMSRLAVFEKGGESRYDCLPLSAKVYLRGAAGSTPASELLVGDEVLCYDHLASSIKFVEVEDTGTETGESQW